jgi:prepilin-type N-terminal cleavage/methylation domain-containing protein
MSVQCHQHGFTLVEIMVSLTLTTILILGTVTLHSHAIQTARTIERRAALEERATFALALMEEDLRMAGFWGLHTDAALLTGADLAQVHCNNNDVSSWAMNLRVSVSSSRNSYPLPCPAFSNAAPNSDTLTVRHASPSTVAPKNNTIQLQTGHTGGSIFSNGVPPSADTGTAIHNVMVRAWYIDQHSSEADLPALRRYELVSGGLMQNQEIMPGVEQLRVELGIDTNADGLLDGFTSSAVMTASEVLAIKITLSLRDASSGAQAPSYIPGEIVVRRLIVLRNEIRT